MIKILWFLAALLLPIGCFAQSAVCPAYSMGWRIIAGTTYTVLPNDQCNLLVFTSTSAVTLYLPVPNANYPYGFDFLEFSSGSGGVTLTAATGTTVNGGSTLAKAQHLGSVCRSNGTAWYCIP
jgi:hypothetical protein